MNVSRESTMPADQLRERVVSDEIRAKASELRFDATISRKLVHRKFIDHVLVTDLRRLDDGHFLCASRLPQMHGYFNEGRRRPCCNIFSVSEIARQASLAISHRYLETPAGFSQIMHRAGGQMEDLSDPRALTPATAEFLVEINLTDRRYRRSGELIGVRAEYVGYSESLRVFRGHGEWELVPQRLYHRLRKQGSDSASPNVDAVGSRTRPIESGSVGRETAQHVVITRPATNSSGSGYGAYLIVDPRHPYFFEHDLDHVPGMLLLEGCYQLAVAIAAKLGGHQPRDVMLERYEMRFFRFAGLQAPVKLKTLAGPLEGTSADRDASTFQITASQAQVVLAEFELTVEPKRPLDGSANLDRPASEHR